MTGFALDGRVPLWVDERPTVGTRVLLLHDLGAAPVDLARLPASWHVIAPHQRGHGRSGRVRGGQYTLPDLAADAARVLRAVDRPLIVAGVGRGALVAALAAAVEPDIVRAVALAPGAAPITCDEDARPARRAWISAAAGLSEIDDGVDPAAALPFAEPLYPDDRDLLWGAVPQPLAWAGTPTGRWTEGARPDVVLEVDGDPLECAVQLVGALARMGASQDQSDWRGIRPASRALPPSA